MKLVGTDWNDTVKSNDNIFAEKLKSMSQKILNDECHPLHANFELLPSGRRYRMVKCRTNRYLNTLVPKAIQALNVL